MVRLKGHLRGLGQFNTLESDDCVECVQGAAKGLWAVCSMTVLI